MGLLEVQLLGGVEVGEVLVVGVDFELLHHPFQEVPPLFQCLDDCQHLLVMDLVVPFNLSEGLGHEGNRVEGAIFLVLG